MAQGPVLLKASERRREGHPPFSTFSTSGPSVAVRGGVQLGGVAASSMSAFFFAREASWGAPPWRCGAGFNSEVLLRARCEFVLWGSTEASWGGPPWRCGAVFNSEMFVRARCPKLQKNKQGRAACGPYWFRYVSVMKPARPGAWQAPGPRSPGRISIAETRRDRSGGIDIFEG